MRTPDGVNVLGWRLRALRIRLGTGLMSTAADRLTYAPTVRPELDDTAAPPERTATQTKEPRPESTELAEGMRLGHFRIEKKLGAGGMGEVYLATDLALDRPVAIKVLPSRVGSATARERMIKEARAQARVIHPNVAHIYFIGEEEGRLYFAMEYVTGKTLAEHVADGPMPVETALSIVRAAVLGLREAQRSGFTHRDVKPSNLMVDNHGVLKVLDFGLVLTAGGAPVPDAPVAQTTMAGTPLYMAPEQARGEAIDLRADIYALGATLYHLVSGNPPFVADSVDALVTMHATAARPSVPRGANPRTTITAIDALIGRMMAPNPADRFDSYDELLRAIEIASVERTRPAGFLVRGIATLIDMILVMIIVGILSIARELTTLGKGDIDPDRYAFLIGAVYAALAISRWGTTAGKALFELEVASIATSQRPTLSQSFRRELALVAVPVAFGWAGFAFKMFRMPLPDWLLKGLELAVLIVVGILLLHAALRVPGKRTPWDRFSGTLVRYRTTRGSTGAAP